MRQLIWKEWHEQSWKLAFGCIVLNVAQPLLKEVVMAQVCIRVGWNHLEVHHHGQAQQIPRLDGHIERGIVHNPHRALHPVNDALSVFARRTAPTQQYTTLVR